MNRGLIFITTAICVSSLSACEAFTDKYDASYYEQPAVTPHARYGQR